MWKLNYKNFNKSTPQRTNRARVNTYLHYSKLPTKKHYYSAYFYPCKNAMIIPHTYRVMDSGRYQFAILSLYIIMCMLNSVYKKGILI